MTNRVEQMKSVQKQALEIFAKKNADYGDSFATYGVMGVLVRLNDKIQRSLNISKTGITLVENENIKDTLIDLHNYAAMALMLMDEKITINESSKYNKNGLSEYNDIV